jgi:hypothetical protein
VTNVVCGTIVATYTHPPSTKGNKMYQVKALKWNWEKDGQELERSKDTSVLL